MGYLFSCAVCCMLLSVWAVIQLSLMGIFYYIEATVLLEDVEDHEYVSYDEFIKSTTKNYGLVAINCWIAAGAYALMAVICYLCVLKANKSAAKETAKLEDDELSCKPTELVRNVKIKQ